MRIARRFCLCASLPGLLFGGEAKAHPEEAELPAVVVTREEEREPAAASEKIISGKTINERPISRVGEVLEAVPGLIVTQHSGEGKANQYFLRGYNLDHGTDLAIYVDGMPVNMRTHGHGQGYADINFLIPELIDSVLVRKGPYYAEEGDFSSAGAVHIDYVRAFDGTYLSGTGGSFNYWRGLGIAGRPVGEGNFTVAIEAIKNNGPWDIPDDVGKVNGVLRYTQGSDLDGFSITGMAYHNRWRSTDQVAQRAIDEGIIDRYGSLDPTDGGAADRFSLSARVAHFSDLGQSKIELYGIRSSLKLFNNFTYYLDDPEFGDQFAQKDNRVVLGAEASHTIHHHIGPLQAETRFGVQMREDLIDLGLWKTFQRTPLSTVRDDHVQEQSVGVWADHTTHWTDWMRSTVGVRHDWYLGTVRSDTAENSGDASGSITSPKFALALGPWAKTEFFVNAGYGFHSNDMRGSTITVDPVDKTTAVDRTPLLVRTKGAELGFRTKPVDGLTSSFAAFLLNQVSELLFVGDAGTTEASRPSRRVGIEWTTEYKINPWMKLEFDLAYTKARFTDYDPAGNHIPGAPAWISTASMILGEELGWYGAVTGRYFGPRPLVEDASVKSLSSFIVNARAGYKFSNGIRVQLDAFNLFNTHTNQIEYYYESRLANEADAVFDRHVHPVEPLGARLSLSATF